VAPLNEPRLTRFLTEAAPRGGGVIDPAETADTSSGLNYLYARRAALADPAKAAALRAYVQHFVRALEWVDLHPREWVQSYYVRNQGISAADGQRIADSLGRFGFPRLDPALVQRQQASIDVIEQAGELPGRAAAADGFDTRFDQVIVDAVARPETAAGGVR
jgi:sulfonate transport system substrate-binding protein